MILRKLILISLILFSTLSVDAEYIAFDMDETLIQSDKLLNKDVVLAKQLGFKVSKSNLGIDYILRPGAIELLEYAKEQGFDLIIISHNVRTYLDDILLSSGLFEYFDKVISHEDLVKPINLDFKTYPNHRNKTYPQWSLFDTYTKTFYTGFVLRSWQRLTGNKNIHPFLPSTNNAKYPPMYGARVLIDNATYNVENPVDFVGVKVDDFFANKKEDLSDDWINPLKSDIDYLKLNGWTKLYERNYHKIPIVDKVIVLENLLK